ncbi:family 16 glycosylhydrolase [Marinoscillum sp.]|uniref:family 16 glycosylhydrolase n=1 Tax=Marinoscillum sp. TaxID=2024838 RepID=UPI003BADB460
MQVFIKLFLPSILILSLFGCDSGEGEPSPQLPGISINDLEISEKKEDFNITLDVALSEVSADLIVVSYETVEGSALANQDFKHITGQLIFQAGSKRESITLTILGDEKMEEDESFLIRLFDPANAVMNDSSATIVIKNFDTTPPPNELVIPTQGYMSPESYEGWNLVWQDEFDQETLNTADWTYEIGNGHSGWGNNELEYYTDENTSMVDGNLVITAKKESRGGYHYTSSRIITKDKQEFKYGRVDIRAVLPFGQGIWPALWMLGANIDQVSWPACGEIDIMELIGGTNRDNTTHGTAHWSGANGYANYGGSKKLSSGIFADEYHVFSIIWNENSITWLLDGVEFHVIDITPADLSEFRNDFFLIFNVAVGGNWPGSPNSSTVFPQYMIVDYIRVFQTQ